MHKDVQVWKDASLSLQIVRIFILMQLSTFCHGMVYKMLAYLHLVW